jgi:hypothetical protein
MEEQLLREVAEDFKSQVINAIQNKKIRRRSRRPGVGIFEAEVNASGRLAASVHDEWDDEGVKVLCNAYIDKLIFGQAPGANVNVSDIRQWISDKGLDFKPETIAQQIYLFGNSIWAEHQGADSGLLEDVDISGSLDRLQSKLTPHYANLVALKLIDEFKLAS